MTAYKTSHGGRKKRANGEEAREIMSSSLIFELTEGNL